jgi:hypothetical protein
VPASAAGADKAKVKAVTESIFMHISDNARPVSKRTKTQSVPSPDQGATLKTMFITNT